MTHGIAEPVPDDEHGAGRRLRRAFAHDVSSVRLRAALAAGTEPAPGDVEVLVARCADEPDFFVREMLTWALTRHPAETTVPLLRDELERDESQARSQALHTLSKIGEPDTWAAITADLLHDEEDEVARAAWRAAVALVPAGSEEDLAGELVRELGRGAWEVQLSLSRALLALGHRAEPAITSASTRGSRGARMHALATLRLLEDPGESFEAAMYEADRALDLGS